MITKYKIYESVNNGKLYQILQNMLKTGGEDIIREIENYIDIDFKYKIEYPYREEEFELQLDEDDLENLIGMREGTIHYVRQLSSNYSGYEHWIEKDELEYIGRYLSGDTLKEIEKLADLTGIKIDISEQGEILRLLDELTLEDVIETMMTEIRMEHERAIEDTASDVVDSFPFSFDYPVSYSEFNIQLDFDIGHMMDYIEKNKLEVNSVKEFIEECDWGDFSYEIEHQSYENLGDFKDLNTETYNKIENFTSSPDELMPEFIKGDNLTMLKKMINKAFFDYNYSYWGKGYQRKNYTLFQIAKDKDNSVLEFFKSEKFQRWYLKDLDINVQTERYRQLVDDEINNLKIDDDYEYLIGGENYNL